MKLIGLAGRARSGKDTVGEYLKLNYNFHTYALASPLKKACKEMFGLTESQQQDNLKEEVIPEWGLSPRQMYQTLGTEGGRELFGQDIWIKRARVELKNYCDWIDELPSVQFHSQEPRMVVTDIRFDNEADWIRSEGGVIWHVNRLNENESVHDHISENGITSLPEDKIIYNNSSLDELYKNVESKLKCL